MKLAVTLWVLALVMGLLRGLAFHCAQSRWELL